MSEDRNHDANFYQEVVKVGDMVKIVLPNKEPIVELVLETWPLSLDVKYGTNKIRYNWGDVQDYYTKDINPEYFL